MVTVTRPFIILLISRSHIFFSLFFVHNELSNFSFPRLLFPQMHTNTHTHTNTSTQTNQHRDTQTHSHTNKPTRTNQQRDRSVLDQNDQCLWVLLDRSSCVLLDQCLTEFDQSSWVLLDQCLTKFDQSSWVLPDRS